MADKRGEAGGHESRPDGREVDMSFPADAIDDERLETSLGDGPRRGLEGKSANTLDANGPQGTQQLPSGDGVTEAAGAKPDQRRRMTQATSKAMGGEPAREKEKGQHRSDQFDWFPDAENCLGNSAESPSGSGANGAGNQSDEALSPGRRGCGADGATIV